MNTKADNPTAQILVVDDEVGHAEVMAEGLRRLGHVCTIVHDLTSAKDELSHGQFDLVVTDLSMEGERDGLEVLAEARKSQNNAETIMVTAHGDVPTAKAAIKGGAFDFIEKPIDLDVLRTLCSNAINTVFLREENSSLRQRINEQYGFEGIIGQSPAIRNLIQTMRQIAPSNIPVLITGESGTGKELVAQAIHNNSKRNKKQFVPLNCAGLSESILEDELFGHVRGAFTGADREREGRFEYANNGTLFLDEVGDMPLNMQAKLLRVLESGEVVRLGSNKVSHVDVRFISATNRDLQAKVKDGDFREDLYFRIKGVELHLPSLRERREDIPLLVNHYAQQYAQQLEKPVPSISEDLNMMLMQYDWPGNVRQLINVVQNMVIISIEPQLDPQHLPTEIKQALGDGAATGDASAIINDATGLRLDQIEKQAIRNALRINSGNREQAAKMLGIGERTLYRKLKEYGLK
ncbi:sigma-54-dependent Fis family transcriptional regulator [Planctomycetota bacterium]|nr:sigma-54-dependent Fis family transcriptional regulator [Planctomycetota bacterium]